MILRVCKPGAMRRYPWMDVESTYYAKLAAMLLYRLKKFGEATGPVAQPGDIKSTGTMT